MSEEETQLEANNVTEDQLNKLGLSEHPFTEHAGDAYLYSDSQLDMTSNIIMEYLTNPSTTIVLTGEEGVGKTTYLRKVLRLGYQQYQFCTLRAREGINFLDIENKIKQRWVVPQTNERSIDDLSIENYVITYLREHTHAVLILDDADLLDVPTLDRLFTLKHRIALACPSGLGLILAGENNLKIKISELEDSNPACTQVYQINVRPLNREQTSNYINHRFTTAGLEDEVLLDEPQIDEIYNTSGGNIRSIHQESIRLLQAQFQEENSFDTALDQHITIRKPYPRIPIVLITVIGLLGFGLYMNHRQNVEKEKQVAISIPKQKEIANEQALSPLAQEANSNITIKTPSLPLPNLSTDIAKDLKESKNSADKIDNAIQGVDIDSLKKLEQKQQQVAGKSTTQKDMPKVAVNSTVKKDAPSTTVSALSTGNSSKNSADNVKPPGGKPTHGKEWLLDLNSASYTLQVVATTELSQLENLIKKEQLSRDYAHFSKLVKNTKYHVLVVGNYKTRTDAIDSAKKLPENLRKNNPWPVKLDSVQQHLK